jgi:signal transduction histidine kinase
LGLSISKGLAEKNGGSLVYDQSTANTCFVLELPLDLQYKKAG